MQKQNLHLHSVINSKSEKKEELTLVVCYTDYE